MDFKRLVYEFVGGIIFTSVFGACVLFLEGFFKIYRFFSGELILIILIVLGFPMSCFLGFIATDMKFFGVRGVLSKTRLVWALITSGFLGALGCAVVLDYIQDNYIVKASLLILVSVIVSLFLYNVFNITNKKSKNGL